MKLSRLWILAIIAMLAISCAPKAERTILGHWQAVDGKEQIHFAGDHKVTFIDEAKGLETTCEFRFKDKGVVEFQLGGFLGDLARPITIEAVVAGDELLLKAEDGREFKFQRNAG